MRQNKVKAALRSIQDVQLLRMIEKWFSYADATDLTRDDMSMVMAEFQLLETEAAVQAMEHYFKHHHFLVVSNGKYFMGFYRDSTGAPGVYTSK